MNCNLIGSLFSVAFQLAVAVRGCASIISTVDIEKLILRCFSQDTFSLFLTTMTENVYFENLSKMF
jgi:hypothetical protein